MSFRMVFSALIVAGTLAAPAAAQMQFTFDWAGLKLCTSGSPNKVTNPRFKVTGLPAGTTIIQFRLKDLDAPGYNHGGGWVKMSGDGTAPAGAFSYKSPCPPNGSHTYEWTATARTKKNGKTLAKATARRVYP
jgi:phosphatidylethanolamine-binding protein (PEBP) family uncharacterized protein